MNPTEISSLKDLEKYLEDNEEMDVVALGDNIIMAFIIAMDKKVLFGEDDDNYKLEEPKRRRSRSRSRVRKSSGKGRRRRSSGRKGRRSKGRSGSKRRRSSGKKRTRRRRRKTVTSQEA